MPTLPSRLSIVFPLLEHSDTPPSVRQADWLSGGWRIGSADIPLEGLDASRGAVIGISAYRHIGTPRGLQRIGIPAYRHIGTGGLRYRLRGRCADDGRAGT
jgi:hypothetical protein